MHYSASSIATYLDCPAKWAYIYRDGIRGPAQESARYGSFLHNVLQARRDWEMWPRSAEYEDENGLKGQREVTERDLAILTEAEDKWGPYHAAGHLAEGKFTFQGRHSWVGYRDLRGPGAVEDYKTTSDLKWAMREVPPPGQPRVEGVRYIDEDPQALLYAHTVAVEDQVPEVALDWIYMKTRLPNGSKSVKLRVSSEQAARGFEALEAVADLCEATTTSKDAPRNESACDKYGGCPFRGPGYCNISPFRGRIPDMSAAAEMFARIASGRQAAGLPTSPTPPAPVAVPELPAHAPAPVAVPELTVTGPHPGEAPLAWAHRCGLTVQDEDSAVRAAKMFGYSFVAPSQAVAQAVNPPPVHTLMGTIAQPIVTAELPSLPTLPAPLSPAVEVPKRRGRPPGSRNATPPAAPSTPPASLPSTALASAPAPRSAPTPGVEEGLSIGTLYIGCRPLRSAEVVEFDRVVAHARVEMARGGLADWRLVEYGKGKAHLLEHAVSYLSALGAIDLVVDSRSDEAQVCLPHLRAAAEEVVQAVAA